MTEILKARSDADFLAMVPRLCGYRTRNSLVCVLFRGNRTEAALRLDLPERRRTADARALADFFVATARRSPGVDALLPVVYTDETFEGAHGLPWDHFLDDVLERIHRQGIHLTGAFCVAADGWGSYFDERPVEPRSLYELELSELADDSVVDLESFASLPEVGDVERRAFDIALDDAVDGEECFDLSARVGELVAAPLDTRQLALLALAISLPSRRDETTLRIAFGSVVGDAIAADNLHWAPICARSGLSMDETVTREVDAGRASLDDPLQGLLLGTGRLRPDPERIDRGLHDLGRIAALLGDEDAVPALCMVAWLHWALGQGSAAGSTCEHALRLNPTYPMARLLRTLFSHRPFPEWALPESRDLEHD